MRLHRGANLLSRRVFTSYYIFFYDLVTADCAETTDSSSTINVLSDLDIYVDLHCRDDFLYEVSTSDGVHHDATVNFTGDTSNECVFMVTLFAQHLL